MDPNVINANTAAPAPKKTAKTTLLVLIIVILVVASLFAYGFISKPDSVNLEPVASTTASSTVDIVANETNVKSAQFIIEMSTSSKTADIVFPDGHTTRVPIYWEDWELFQPYVEIVDVNFDGYDDLFESYVVGAYNMSARFYIQDSATSKFSEYQIIPMPRNSEGDLESGLGMTTFNAEKREITSYWKGRGLGDMYILDTFAFRNGKWELIKMDHQDWLSPSDNGYYIRNIVEYNGGKSATTTTYLKREWKADRSSFDLFEVSKEEAMKHINDVING
jgi:hypothetical protein